MFMFKKTSETLATRLDNLKAQMANLNVDVHQSSEGISAQIQTLTIELHKLDTLKVEVAKILK